jgi:hypothetical protein
MDARSPALPLLSLLLASCYSPSYPSQYRCSVAKPACPAGLRCNGSLCVPSGAAEVGADAPVDRALAEGRGQDSRNDAYRGDLARRDGPNPDGSQVDGPRLDLFKADLSRWLDGPVAPDVKPAADLKPPPPDLPPACPATSCFINGVCYGPGAQNAACGACNPGLVRTAWSPAAGCVGTLVKGLNGPYGVTVGGGNVYVAESAGNRILLIDNGQPIIIAGTLYSPQMKSFDAGYYYVASYLNGDGAQALLNNPSDLAFVNGALVVVDQNNDVIRRVVLTAPFKVTTLAGIPAPVFPAAPANEAPRGLVDGPAQTAQFYYPSGLDSFQNDVYVIDRGNRAIRKIDANGQVSTPFSTGLSNPWDMVCVGTNVFLTDNHAVLGLSLTVPGTPPGTVAGLAGVAGFVDGIGGAARFDGPTGITVGVINGSGKLLVADTNNHRVRLMELTNNQVGVLAGNGTMGHVDGLVAAAQFAAPMGVSGGTVGGIFYVFVADTSNGAVRVIRP